MNSNQVFLQGTRWCVVLEGQFTEVQDFVSEIGRKLRSSLHASEIKLAHEDAEEEEDDTVVATLTIHVKDGNELQQVAHLLKTETYKWINLKQEAQEQHDDNGHSLQIA